MTHVLCFALAFAGCTLGNGLYAYYRDRDSWQVDTLWHACHYAFVLTMAGLLLWLFAG
jgi:hypothetical protein